jgi:hypothetical protein
LTPDKEDAWMLRKLRPVLEVILGIATILSLAPVDWANRAGAWWQLLVEQRIVLLVAFTATMIVRLIVLELRERLPVELLPQIDLKNPLSGQDEVPEFFPRQADRTLRSILRRLGDASSDTPHVVRIWLATGETILRRGYLEHFFKVLRPRASFDVRILMIDPESPVIEECGHEDWSQQVRDSVELLSEMQDRYRHKPATISWRTYRFPPMIRSVLIDEDYLIFGFMTWFREPEGLQLHHQNTSYIYMRRRQRGASEFIDFVKNWFDHEWELGRETPPV